MKKTLSLLLAMLMLAGSFVACAGGNTEETDNKANTDKDNVDYSELQLDPNLSYNDKTVTIAANPCYPMEDGEIEVTEFNAVDSAFYDRDLSVEDLLDVKLEYMTEDEVKITGSINIRKYVQVGDAYLDIIAPGGSQTFKDGPSVLTLLYDMSEVDNIELNSDWWYTDIINNLSYNGKAVNILVGDIEKGNLGGLYVIYYNKKVFNEIFHNPEQPYEDVINDVWTIDKYSEYVSKGYKDTNGNQKKDLFDSYGSRTNPVWHVGLYRGFEDVRFFSRDEDGYPYIDIDLDRAVIYAEKLTNLLWNNEGMKVWTDSTAGWDTQAIAEFSKDQYMFMPSGLQEIEHEELRGMEADFGVLPFFKLDETQEEYRTHLSASWSQFYCVPSIVNDVEMSAAVMEAMGYYANKLALPVYYEAALKASYVRDSMAGQVIDMVRDSAYVDFMQYFHSSVTYHFNLLVAANKSDYVSSWNSEVKSYRRTLDDYIEELDEYFD